MKVSLRAKIKDEKQRNDFYEVLKLICDQEKLQLEERGEGVVVEICPQGMIECREDGNTYQSCRSWLSCLLCQSDGMDRRRM